MFEAALDVPADRRRAFVAEASGGDAALRAEVEALLDRHDQSDGFLEPPVPPDETPSPRASDSGGSLTRQSFAAPARDGRASLVGTALGPYEIVREIGRGGMGVVYEGRDTRLGRRVAIKSLPVEFAHDNARRLRLQQEARAAALLNHPGVAAVYALEEFGDELFIVTEFVSGHTLRVELERGPVPLARVLALFQQMAAALAAAHARGVVHRDLKPENVMITEDDVVKIVDFGLARIATDGSMAESLTKSSVMLGTPAYMAPEQVRAQPTDFRTDLFEFGVVLYECVSGQHPFSGGDLVSTLAHIVEAEPQPLAMSVKGDLRVAALQPIIDQCLRKEPDRRYRSTSDLVHDLELVTRIIASGSGERPASGLRSARGSSGALWWWQFHQGVVCALDCVMLLLGWFVQWKAPFPPVARAMFFAALAAGVVDVGLRGHLLFMSRVGQGELANEIARVGPWTRGVHALFLAILLAAAFALLGADRPGTAAIFFIVALGGGVSFLVIEPSRRPM